MGLIEVEFGKIIEAAAKKGPGECEKVMRKMALIIDRQAGAINTVRWSDDALKKAKGLDEWMFQEIQELQREGG